jgi:transcription antitermination factor NusG
MQEGDWYVIHSYAGYENRVKQNLENRTVSLNLEEFIFEAQVPMEDVVEIKNGQRKQVRRVRIPGYVLVRMELTDESWGAVRHTPGVTGFVGNAYDPTPLSIDEVFSMLAPIFEERQAEAAAAEGPAAEAAAKPAPDHRGGVRGRRVRPRQGGLVRGPPRHDPGDPSRSRRSSPCCCRSSNAMFPSNSASTRCRSCENIALLNFVHRMQRRLADAGARSDSGPLRRPRGL